MHFPTLNTLLVYDRPSCKLGCTSPRKLPYTAESISAPSVRRGHIVFTLIAKALHFYLE